MGFNMRSGRSCAAMKRPGIVLFLAALLLLIAFAARWFDAGTYMRNFEMDAYDPHQTFIEPTVITRGLAVYIVGEGEPILLFPYPHAGTSEPMAQSDLADKFAALGRRVITFDVPGAYASTREPQVDMAEMLECALDALEAAGVAGKIDVAGHSMGGLVALAFALEHPGRVDQLLLINTLSGFDASLKWGLPGSAWAWHQKEYWQLIYWGILLQSGHGDLAMHKRLMHILEEASYVDKSRVLPLVIDERDKGTATPVRFRWSKALWDIGYADQLERLAAPTLITAGRYDPQTPIGCAQELAEGIPNSRLEVFEMSGHNPFVEETDTFWAVVEDFLQE